MPIDTEYTGGGLSKTNTVEDAMKYVSRQYPGPVSIRTYTINRSGVPHEVASIQAEAASRSQSAFCPTVHVVSNGKIAMIQTCDDDDIGSVSQTPADSKSIATAVLGVLKANPQPENDLMADVDGPSDSELDNIDREPSFDNELQGAMSELYVEDKDKGYPCTCEPEYGSKDCTTKCKHCGKYGPCPGNTSGKCHWCAS